MRWGELSKLDKYLPCDELRVSQYRNSKDVDAKKEIISEWLGCISTVNYLELLIMEGMKIEYEDLVKYPLADEVMYALEATITLPYIRGKSLKDLINDPNIGSININSLRIESTNTNAILHDSMNEGYLTVNACQSGLTLK